MGGQYNKCEKRRRREKYLKRVKQRTKTATGVPEAPKAAPAPAPAVS
jgi:hypothetical protein